MPFISFFLSTIHRIEEKSRELYFVCVAWTTKVLSNQEIERKSGKAKNGKNVKIITRLVAILSSSPYRLINLRCRISGELFTPSPIVRLLINHDSYFHFPPVQASMISVQFELWTVDSRNEEWINSSWGKWNETATKLSVRWISLRLLFVERKNHKKSCDLRRVSATIRNALRF